MELSFFLLTKSTIQFGITSCSDSFHLLGESNISESKIKAAVISIKTKHWLHWVHCWVECSGSFCTKQKQHNTKTRRNPSSSSSFRVTIVQVIPEVVG